MRRLILAAALLLTPIAASAATLTPAAADAQKVLAAAQPGDTVILTGQLGQMTINGKSGLTIDASAAQLTSVYIKASDTITWKGGKFTPADWQGAVYVDTSGNVTVQDVSVFGADRFNGVFFRDSNTVNLLRAKIDRARVGVNFLHVTGGLVSSADLTGFAIDGVDIASSHQVAIEYVACLGNLLVDTHHPDCVQAWSLQGEPPTSDIVVRNGMAKGGMQGVGFYDHGAGGYERVTIEGFTAALSYANGIYVNAARGLVVRNNRTFTLPGAPWRTSINLIGDNTAVTRCGNVVAPGAGNTGITDPACPAN